MKRILYLLIFFTQILLSQGWVKPSNGLLIWENNGWIWATGPGIVNDYTFFVKTHDISNCILHLSTDGKQFADGDVIQTWADNAFYGNDASQATETNRPVYDLTTDTGSLVFDGVDDYMAISNSPSTQNFINSDFTIALWINPVSVTNRTFIRQGDYGIDMAFTSRLVDVATLYLWTSSDGIDNDRTIYTINPALELNKWQHMAIVCENRLVTIYINSVAMADTETILSNIYETTDGITLGEWGNWDYSGKIDDIQIFTKALSTSEIASLYANKVQAVKLINIE